MAELAHQPGPGGRSRAGTGQDNGTYCYGDYATWPEQPRCELVRGRVYAMSPSPSWRHQKITMKISARLGDFLKGKPCQPFIAPMDVFLPRADQTKADINAVDTVVQPDLGVVCDPDKIMDRGVWGAPDVVMEVLSPASVLHDMNRKKDLYAAHGCREYWIWEGNASWVIILHRLEGGGWDQGSSFGPGEVAVSQILPGFSVDVEELRQEL